MHRVDTPGHADGLWQDGNPQIGQQGTIMSFEWLNDHQENLCKVVEDAGIALVKGDTGQLKAAIIQMITSRAVDWSPAIIAGDDAVRFYAAIVSDNARTAAITSANGYTDTARAAAITSANGYTDAARTAAVASAGAYTDTVATATRNYADVVAAALATAAQNAAVALARVRTGVVELYAGTAVPSGYLECNGAAVSRSTYADLFAAIGTRYGVGDGGTTFNLPQAQGEFIRGWDNGRGVDPGRSLGSWQDQELISHSHALPVRTNADAGDGWIEDAGATDTVRSASTAATGGDETRPRNIAFMVIIKV